MSIELIPKFHLILFLSSPYNGNIFWGNKKLEKLFKLYQVLRENSELCSSSKKGSSVKSLGEHYSHFGDLKEQEECIHFATQFLVNLWRVQKGGTRSLIYRCISPLYFMIHGIWDLKCNTSLHKEANSLLLKRLHSSASFWLCPCFA